jgi:hypothetical protein
VRLTGVSLSDDQFHAFRAVDPNDDNVYQMYYDNNKVGVDSTATINVASAWSATESESSCSSDSLWAQFNELKYIATQNGSLINYVDNLLWADINSGV